MMAMQLLSGAMLERGISGQVRDSDVIIVRELIQQAQTLLHLLHQIQDTFVLP